MNRLVVGSGDKYNLLIDMMCRDFSRGFLLIDPTGQLAELAANAIPKSHIERTFYFCADKTHAPAFNVLNDVPEDVRILIAPTIRIILDILYPEGASTLTRIRSNYLLTQALRQLLDQPNSTLLDVIEVVKGSFPEWDKKDREASILDIETRLGDLLSTPFLRTVVGQPRSTFSLTKGKIVIVNLDSSVVGDATAKFLTYLFLIRATGPIYINDLPALAHDHLATLFSRGGFTVATDVLPSERRYPDLRQALLRMEPYVFRTTKHDADELMFSVRLPHGTPLTDLGPQQYYAADSRSHDVPEISLHGYIKSIRKRSRARHTRPL